MNNFFDFDMFGFVPVDEIATIEELARIDEEENVYELPDSFGMLSFERNEHVPACAR